MIVTIDGPAASGKSTAARLLAMRLGFYYLNSGLLYRAIGYLLLEHGGYTLDNLAQAIEHDIAVYLDPKRIHYVQNSNSRAHIFFDDEEITNKLKTERIDKAASVVSTNTIVRSYLFQFQRALAATNHVIVEGRDSGTVVFPQAEMKFFLTASLEVRALRWQKELEQKGVHVSEAEAQAQLLERDKRDSERKVAPLKIPEHAIVIDNSAYTIDQTVDVLARNIERAMLTNK